MQRQYILAQDHLQKASYSKAEMKLMTPGQVKRMPPTECIVFFESRPPIYDTKAIPFDKPEYGFVAADWLKDRYKAALSLGDYEHPVETIYDPEKRSALSVIWG